MTTLSNLDSAVSTIGVTVPDGPQAAEFFASLLGGRLSVQSDGAATVTTGGISVEFASASNGRVDHPRLVDLGTNHLCFTVGDIDRAAEHLASRPDVAVLGDVVTTPDGPIEGNKWVYFRSPSGALFELQQWPDHPAYFGATTARLRHSRVDVPSATLPTCRGLDHTGYSVPDIDAAVALLVADHGATEVLRTEITADRGFMLAQFDLDVAGTSRMAMVSAGELNIELFQHDIGVQSPPRRSDEVGATHLVLGRTTRLIPGEL
jgi:catechol 2,3-dioxygenase-like lactoylglutathione lyase family enzyme